VAGEEVAVVGHVEAVVAAGLQEDRDEPSAGVVGEV
jgi:hypothetical protein